MNEIRRNQVKDSVNDAMTDYLLEVARDYHARDFPNPSRTGCPPAGDILALVVSRLLPDERLRAHLFNCSECFREYRHALSRLPQIVSVITPTRSRLSALLTWKTAAAFVMLLIVSLAILAIYSLRKQPVKTASINTQKRPNEATLPSPVPSSSLPSKNSEFTKGGEVYQPEQSTEPSKTHRASALNNRRDTPPSSGRHSKPAGNSASAKNIVDVDLNSNSLLRDSSGANSENQQPIVLPPHRSKLRIKLPNGSQRGIYYLTLVDAFGRRLFRRRVFTEDGLTVIASMDLSNFEGQQPRLCLARSGEIPDCFIVAIMTKRLNSP